jgi:hypothetical protein
VEESRLFNELNKWEIIFFPRRLLEQNATHKTAVKSYGKNKKLRK